MSFNPRKYLEEYYSEMEVENQQLLQFWQQVPIRPNSVILEIGGGPSIFVASIIAKLSREYYLTDLEQANIDELNLWLAKSPTAFDWGSILLEIDPLDDIAKWLREKITSSTLDIAKPNGQHHHLLSATDLVVSAFCIETSKNRDQLRQFFANCIAYVKPGGLFALNILTHSTTYAIDGTVYSVTDVDQQYVNSLFTENGFTELYSKEFKAKDHLYERICVAWGRKSL